MRCERSPFPSRIQGSARSKVRYRAFHSPPSHRFRERLPPTAHRFGNWAIPYSWLPTSLTQSRRLRANFGNSQCLSMGLGVKNLYFVRYSTQFEPVPPVITNEIILSVG